MATPFAIACLQGFFNTGFCSSLHVGTPLGDPIEVSALGQALTANKIDIEADLQCITLASVKSCFGHTEGAAGLTGALQALQCMIGQHAFSVRPLLRKAPLTLLMGSFDYFFVSDVMESDK